MAETSQDLTTLVTIYLKALRNANPTKKDSTTLFVKDRPTIVAGSTKPDENTRYWEYL